MPARGPRRGAALCLSALLVTVLAGGCSAGTGAATVEGDKVVQVVAAESQYGNVASLVGGRYVHVTAIMSNPNTDPHDFEASVRVASEISQAGLAVQNGLGYDEFMSKLEAADAPHSQMVVVAGHLVRNAPGEHYNPHLWYYPATMPAVAAAIASDLGRLRPAHKAYFSRREASFDASLGAWRSALALLRAKHRGAPVAVTEPVADYLLQAASLRVLTPRSLEVAVMDGTDPSPQDITAETDLIERHRVEVLVYNQQVQDSLTKLFLGQALHANVPVVGVYETMPSRAAGYASWMVSTVSALSRALGTFKRTATATGTGTVTRGSRA